MTNYYDKLHFGRFMLATCRQKRFCKVCLKCIPSDKYHLVAYFGYNTVPICIEHFSEEIQNAVKIELI